MEGWQKVYEVAKQKALGRTTLTAITNDKICSESLLLRHIVVPNSISQRARPEQLDWGHSDIKVFRGN